jgi:hypothetical protein
MANIGQGDRYEGKISKASNVEAGGAADRLAL